MKIGVMGAGYVGLTTGICLASLNHNVSIYDISSTKIQQINNKITPFFEDGLDELLTKTISSNSLQATNDINELVKNSECCFVCVGTPSNPNNSIDLSQIISAITSLANSMKKLKKLNYTIIIRSTIIPSTTRLKILPLLKKILQDQQFGLCVVPEFLRESQAVKDFMNPDKIVIGSFEKISLNQVEKIFQNFKNKTNFVKTNPETAELIKYANNTFFSTLISFANEISNIAENVGNVDAFEVINALTFDKRITTTFQDKKITPELISYLLPGCGFGGSCFPKDIKAIVQYAVYNKINTPLLHSVLKINEERPQKIITIAESLLGTLRDKKISILGLTFKPETDDVRSSPALDAIKILQENGSKVLAYDPVISKNTELQKIFDFPIASSISECLQNSDVCLLFTKWPEFNSIDRDLLKKHMKKPLIIDGRGFLNKNNFDKNTYYKIGLVEKMNEELI